MPKSAPKDPSSISSSHEKGDIPACFVPTHGIITATTNDLPDYRITKTLGTIYGLTVRSRNWGADIGGFLKSAAGGELRVFTNLLYSARHEAMERLVGECMARGGQAIVATRFDVSEYGPYIQVCAYGTAVQVEHI